ncbi:MAG TPA: beta-N-acetylhexosaminidase [Gemmatimonadaceae bacterium]|nr:beta-N-acetylhexosaminidase [Gemmatimonadaceae bacterium]
MTRYDLSRLALLGVATIAACGPRTAPVPVVNRAAPRVAVVPAPVSLLVGNGAPFALRDSVIIVIDAGNADAARIANTLATLVKVSTAFPAAVRDGALPRGAIRLRLDANRSDLGDEGYTLNAVADSLVIVARAPAGLFHGIQTLRQMLPYQIESDMGRSDLAQSWTVPPVSITDAPRFAWRGAMLDVARHFFTVDEVKQYIDMLALYKMNRLHLHLADDQGWRIEIKSRPTLTSIGGVMQVGGAPGGFYTQDDYAEIVRYAAERYVTIVPEIDMPAHINAALLAFPQLSCGKRAPAPYMGTEVGFSAICPDSTDSYRLIDDFVREIAAITPGPYFHIGGDEVQALTDQQYASFIERVQDIVARHGKTMVGWDEIRHARLLPTSVVQVWRPGQDTTSMGGAKVILSPANKLYVDMQYAPQTELGLHWAAYVEPDTVYNWNPATLSATIKESDILGIEAPLWAETIRNITAAMFLAVPRVPTAAEVAWTPQAARNWDDFRQRIATHAPRWRILGINYYPTPQIPWY